jgi:uncharacterized membrane protein HdeD (DUF308 family)
MAIAYEMILVLIALAFIMFFTIEFIVSLKRNRRSLIGKTWRWLKNVFDAICGIE